MSAEPPDQLDVWFDRLHRFWTFYRLNHERRTTPEWESSYLHWTGPGRRRLRGRLLPPETAS